MTNLIQADLVVVGAGYAGVNAVYAAARYIPKGGKIVWIDQRKQLGGQWVDQYDYVTLHQPYETFTVGGRSWGKDWHWSHLATKPEILEYFETAIQSCSEDYGIEIHRLFGHNMDSHSVVLGDEGRKLVRVLASAVDNPEEQTAIVSGQLIKATGFDVPIKKGIQFSAAEAVESTCPVDLFTEDVARKVRESTKPVFVLGSGKTAIDTMNMLSKTFGIADRVNCICGRGTVFVNRDVAFPKSFSKGGGNMTKTFTDWSIDVAEFFNGENSQELLQEFQRQGFLHTPIEGSRSFVVGICSTDEVETVRKALHPPEQKVTRAHLVDIVMEGSKVMLKLRSLDGKSFFYKEIPEGSFIVNCTDHVSAASATWEPVVSCDGLVVAPQYFVGFSGPSATFVTHLHYLGQLDKLWREIPRLAVNQIDKAKAGVLLFLTTWITAQVVTDCLPRKLAQEVNSRPTMFPLEYAIPGFKRLRKVQKSVFQRIQAIVPTRYTDPCDGGDILLPVLAGNIGVAAGAEVEAQEPVPKTESIPRARL